MFGQVMVPLDTSELAEQALPTAAAIAGVAGAELHLVLVHEPKSFVGLPAAAWNGARASIERKYMDDKARELKDRFGIGVSVEHATGPIAPTIAKLAAERHVELIVMTSHGLTGVTRAWIGSVADTLIRTLDVPVLMLRASARVPTETLPFHRVMLALDGSRRAESIIDSALDVGGPNATYVITRVVAPMPAVITTDPYSMTALVTDPDATDLAVADATRYVSLIACRFAERGATNVEQVVAVSDDAAPMLLHIAAAHGVDLIALGTHGRGATRLVLGSVADRLLQGSKTPLLVCREPRS